MGSDTLSQGVKWLGHEPDHSPPPSAEVMNTWSYSSTPAYIFIITGYNFMAWYLVKHRDNFTFTFNTGLFVALTKQDMYLHAYSLG
jgi:hypothetical protein